MTCKTCKREDVSDECGPKDGKKCPCCGMSIIATTKDTKDN